MGSTVLRKTRFWRRSSAEVESMSYVGGATATEAQMEATGERRISIAEGPGGKVELIQVTSDTSPEFTTINTNADVLCIDLHEFKIEPALAWIKRRQGFAVVHYGGPAVIAVLADIDELTMDDLNRISWELEPAGAKLCRWPDGCHSFDEAFSAFAESLRERYQWPSAVAQ